MQKLASIGVELADRESLPVRDRSESWRNSAHAAASAKFFAPASRKSRRSMELTFRWRAVR